MMNLRTCAFAIMIVTLASCKKHPTTDLAHQNLIPLPVSIAPSDGVFELTDKTTIQVENATPELLTIAQFLADHVNPATGYKIGVGSAPEAASGVISFSLKGGDPELGEEGYELNIAEKEIKISANKPAGLFFAVQTLRQILPAAIEHEGVQSGPWEIPTGVIRDHPVYAWRGSMLDVARHFFGVEDVKRYIDLISLYKMNTLHLGLTNDQGWRIEIKSWPDLATIGGSTQVGGGKGGFYTQDQFSDIVAYAKSRYITIIPEVDLPGHINAALASYGDLNGGTIVPAEGRVAAVRPVAPGDLGKKSKSKPTDLYTGIKVGWSTLRVEKEVTFKFVDDVIRELAAITPGPYIHIGGDEAQATKKEDYIKFVNRFTKIVKDHGKKMIGWEEIAQGNLNGDVITQYWHSSRYAIMAAEKGSKIVMSPSKKAYLDMKYDSTTKLGLHWAGYIEVDTAYIWNPATLAPGLPAENILGVEAALWSETISTMDEIEYLLFPRLPGYAEIGWSKPEGRKWDEYKVRLGKQAARFKVLGIDYYHSPKVPWVE